MGQKCWNIFTNLSALRCELSSSSSPILASCPLQRSFIVRSASCSVFRLASEKSEAEAEAAMSVSQWRFMEFEARNELLSLSFFSDSDFRVSRVRPLLILLSVIVGWKRGNQLCPLQMWMWFIHVHVHLLQSAGAEECCSLLLLRALLLPRIIVMVF